VVKVEIDTAEEASQEPARSIKSSSKPIDNVTKTDMGALRTLKKHRVLALEELSIILTVSSLASSALPISTYTRIHITTLQTNDQSCFPDTQNQCSL
jgi:hypothetical protein